MKKNVLKKLTALCLVGTMILSTTAIAFAADSTYVKEISISDSFTITNSDGELLVERIIADDSVKVTVKDENGSLLAEAIRNRADITVFDYSNPDNPVCFADKLEINTYMDEVETSMIISKNTNSISWGPEQTDEITFKATGMSAAAIIAYLAASFAGLPAVAFDGLLNTFASFQYPYATVEVSKKYGTDSNYQYTQATITVYGRNYENGTKYAVYGPVVRTYKKSLNS